MNIAILLLTAAPFAQSDTLRLSLTGAVERALAANPTLRAERAEATAAAQAPLAASRAFLPTLRFDAGAVRTTDPVAVFGMKLRQENFAAEDLALDPLNRPDPYAGYAATALVELPVLAPEGLFGFAAARHAAAARQAATERAAGTITFAVTQAYWNSQLAARRVEALTAAHRAAVAHAGQAEALLAQGLVTGLDARLARIRAADIDAQRIGAEADRESAVAHVAMLLALDTSAHITLTDSLSADRPSHCEATEAACATEQRGDIVAIGLGAEAASLAVKSAWASNLPSLAVFGNVARYSRSSPWGEGSSDWTVGIGLTWRPFQALAGVAAVRRARADREAALARLESAERQARLETDNARRQLAAANARAAVAADADAEARAALEQARLRYRTGTSPITELLDVEAAATAATLNLLATRRDLLLARAALDFALGAYDR